MVYSGPTFLLSYFLSSLPIAVLTTCAAALILFRSVLRTYIRSARVPPSSYPIPPHHTVYHLWCRSHTLQVCIRNIDTVYSGPTFLVSYLLFYLPITASHHLGCALEHRYGLQGPHLPPLPSPLLPLSSLSITAITACAAALILFRSAL
jgi:hypothetical protein